MGSYVSLPVIFNILYLHWFCKELKKLGITIKSKGTSYIAS